MALSMRWRQEQNKICLDLWAGAEGLSELDVTASVANFTTNTWDHSEIEHVQVGTYLTTPTAIGQGSGDHLNLLITVDVTAGAIFPTKQWVNIVKCSVTTPVAGEIDGTVTLGTLAKAADASGTDISATTTLAPTFNVKHLTSTQASGAALLTSMAPTAGLAADTAATFASSSDFLARRHLSDYDSTAPTGPFGGGDAPIINANLSDDDFRTLLSAGLMTRGKGANANKLKLTEAGKRTLDYAL